MLQNEVKKLASGSPVVSVCWRRIVFQLFLARKCWVTELNRQESQGRCLVLNSILVTILLYFPGHRKWIDLLGPSQPNRPKMRDLADKRTIFFFLILKKGIQNFKYHHNIPISWAFSVPPNTIVTRSFWILSSEIPLV